jgi:PAS domain S-box-containing protein
MFDFLAHLFDTSGFPPRWNCGRWTEGHGWLHNLSDLGIWSAYLTIPCVLGYFILRRKDIPFRTIFVLFGAFILACGTTHLMEALIFWWPAYRLAGVIKLFTALVSLGTVVALVPVVPKVLAMRSPEELEREIDARTLAEKELHRANADLERRVEERTKELMKAAATQRQSDQRTRIILESITDAFFAVDQDWRFTYVNPQAERLLDRKPGDLLGQVIWEVYSGLVGSEFERVYRRVANEQVTLTLTSYYPDHDRWYEVHVYPAPDGGISIYFQDVSERKRAEAEVDRLREASEQQRRIYETALSNSADFNYVFDLHGRFRYVNQALLALWVKPLHEAVGKNFFDLGYPPDLAARLQRQFKRLSTPSSRSGMRRRTRAPEATGSTSTSLCRSWRRTARWKRWRVRPVTSPTGRWPRRRCETPTGARMSSWRRWHTNSATRWPPSATACMCCVWRAATEMSSSRPGP